MFSELVVEDCDITSPDLIAKQEIAKKALGRQDSDEKRPPSERQEMVYEEQELELIEEREAQEESSISKNMSFDLKENLQIQSEMDFSMT